MNTIFLTSYLDFDDENELEEKTPKNFGNKNNILDNFKKYIKKYDNFLYIASDETNTEITDYYADIAFKSFDMTLPFKNYQILDIRTETIKEELIKNADFIFLCGGHVPTQDKFFKNINLKELLKNTTAVICGGSAGSMNCATNIYCPPELEGESIDPNFNKYFPGLGLTNINILPHFNDYQDLILDNKKYIEDIIIPDSYKTDIYAIDDGSYFIINNNKTILYGEAYLIKNGKIEMINKDNEIKKIKEDN
ncbi:MAG: Type 1 glutamine amidotransferase-like domain-containing protein [Bacilli bacterium]|nr:Type 1 glutamine amidotransferase-like domain-containing protein [Bacilli bacterium]